MDGYSRQGLFYDFELDNWEYVSRTFSLYLMFSLTLVTNTCYSEIAIEGSSGAL